MTEEQGLRRPRAETQVLKSRQPRPRAPTSLRSICQDSCLLDPLLSHLSIKLCSYLICILIVPAALVPLSSSLGKNRHEPASVWSSPWPDLCLLA